MIEIQNKMENFNPSINEQKVTMFNNKLIIINSEENYDFTYKFCIIVTSARPKV